MCCDRGERAANSHNSPATGPPGGCAHGGAGPRGAVSPARSPAAMVACRWHRRRCRPAAATGRSPMRAARRDQPAGTVLRMRPAAAAASGARSQDESDGPPEMAVAFNRSFGTEGICAVGDTLWIGYRGDSTLQAFDRSTGERDEASDLILGDPARGMWCDGETLWYTTKNDQRQDLRLRHGDGHPPRGPRVRHQRPEIQLRPLQPRGVSGVGRWGWRPTATRCGWPATRSNHRNWLYALDMSTKARKPGSDIALGRHFHPRGLFTDGEFLWVASSINSTVRAYDTSTLERVESLDLKVDDFEHDGSWGLWSDGEHMWVCNFRYGKVRGPSDAEGLRAAPGDPGGVGGGAGALVVEGV